LGNNSDLQCNQECADCPQQIEDLCKSAMWAGRLAGQAITGLLADLSSFQSCNLKNKII
jgi:hypothetical protein